MSALAVDSWTMVPGAVSVIERRISRSPELSESDNLDRAVATIATEVECPPREVWELFWEAGWDGLFDILPCKPR